MFEIFAGLHFLAESDCFAFWIDPELPNFNHPSNHEDDFLYYFIQLG